MNTGTNRPGLILGFVAALMLSACATVDEPNQLVVEARELVNAAQQTPAVTQHAALTLEQAEENLQQAEDLWEEYGDDRIEVIEHRAFLAKHQAETALQRAALGEARQEIAQANLNRERILRQARQRDLTAAEQRAQLAQERAEEAERRAQTLEQEVQSARQQAQSAREQEDEELQQLRQTVQELQAQRTERGMVLTLDDVLFDFGESELKPGGERAVEQLATFLEENPDRKVLVEGFTDAVGEEDFNRELSRERADAVRRQLQQAGISADRIEIEAYGEEYPVASNDSNAGRQLNRRVEVVLGSEGEGVPETRTEENSQ